MVLLIVSDMTDNNDTTLSDLDAQLRAASADADASAASLESAVEELAADVADDADAPDTETATASPADLLPIGDANVVVDSDEQALLADDVEISTDTAAERLPTGGTGDEEVVSEGAEPIDDVTDVPSGSDADVAEAPVVDDPNKRPGKWFVVHTQSGYEKKVPVNPATEDYVVMVLAGYNYDIEPAPLKICRPTSGCAMESGMGLVTDAR